MGYLSGLAGSAAHNRAFHFGWGTLRGSGRPSVIHAAGIEIPAKMFIRKVPVSWYCG
jgi:hypothetical protein